MRFDNHQNISHFKELLGPLSQDNWELFHKPIFYQAPPENSNI